MSETTRPPARAGQFYPGDPADMNAAIDRLLPSHQPKTPYRAIMLPHAGWLYSGQTLGKTLARTAVPDTVIIIGPKLTLPFGPHRLRRPSQTMANPRRLPSPSPPTSPSSASPKKSTASSTRAGGPPHGARQRGVSCLFCIGNESGGPRPSPIVLGQITFEDALAVGRAVSRLVQECESAGQKVLLVISSDMNHFGSEAENHRLDHLAIDAMATGHLPGGCTTPARRIRSACAASCPAVAVDGIAAADDAGDQARNWWITQTSSAASGNHERVVGYAGVVGST